MLGKHTADYYFLAGEFVGAVGKFGFAEAQLHASLTQSLNNLTVALCGEITHDRFCDFRTDFGD